MPIRTAKELLIEAIDGKRGGAGAKNLLISKELRRVAEEIMVRVEYVELTTHVDFQKVFMERLYFELVRNWSFQRAFPKNYSVICSANSHILNFYWGSLFSYTGKKVSTK